MALMRSVWWRGLPSILVVGLIAGVATRAQAQQTASAGTTPRAMVSAEATSAQQSGAAQDGFTNFFRKTEVAGTVDMYFHYNFNEPPTGSLTPLRNFDFEHNQFSFALAELAFIKPAVSDDRVGFRFDFDYGPVTDWVHGADPEGVEVVKHIQQGYLSYLAPIGTGLTFEVGKFVTQHGAEVIEAKDNWNYSRSLLFSWAIPYYHMGVRVGYAPNDKISLMADVVNGWNNTKDNNSQRTYGAQVTLKPVSPLSILVNYMGGPEQTDNTDDWRHLVDATVTYAVNDKFSVMGNADYGVDTIEGADVSWKGVALYAKAQATPIFAVIPRFEYYDDSDGGFTTSAAQKLKEFTLTAEVKHSQGLIMRLEYRRDWSDIDFFTKDGNARDNQNTFSVGFIYGFSSK
jgi:Putative beta-barrel porin-2, OmpL-like. bbp2